MGSNITLMGQLPDPRKVSVVIPSYNMAKYLGETIRSILNQSYQNLEIIVVNDASTDHTDQVMQQFDDPRVKYIVHKENRYAAAARNTGIHASDGGFIAFVDADDMVHPEKLMTQVAFLERNPEIGLVYCSRIEIDQGGVPLNLVPASPIVVLEDLVLDYPYAPSEVVMRREWISRVGLYDESFRFSGEDPDFHMRLALHGCGMAGLRRALNYRRIHPGRVRKNLDLVVADGIRAFQNTFNSPLCPAEVMALRARSLGMLHRVFSYLAFFQNDTLLGQNLLRKAVEYGDLSITDDPSNYIDFVVRSSIRGGGEHESVLRSILRQSSSVIEGLSHYTEFAIGQGYLLKWSRDFLWGRVDAGLQNLENARVHGSNPDNSILKLITMNLLNHEEHFGVDAANDTIDRFVMHLHRTGNRTFARKLKSSYMINRAFREYRTGERTKVLSNVVGAIGSDPSYLINRGVLSMLFYSTLGHLKLRL